MFKDNGFVLFSYCFTRSIKLTEMTPSRHGGGGGGGGDGGGGGGGGGGGDGGREISTSC